MGKLILSIVMFCVPFVGVAQKIYVVSVGISDYKEIRSLMLPENDVRTFNSLMSLQGAEIKTLLGQSATHVNVITALRSLAAKAQRDDMMIFFFSGHGYEGGFCCWDMSSKSPSANANGVVHSIENRERLAITERYYGGLSYSEMQILFRNCRASKKIVIADACFSGGLNKGEQLNLSVQSARNGECVYFMSSQMDETSLEMKGASNGLFTQHLSEGLRGRADKDKNGKITIKEIYDYVYRAVVDYADRLPHSQHPVLWGKYDGAMTIYELNK